MFLKVNREQIMTCLADLCFIDLIQQVSVAAKFFKAPSGIGNIIPQF